MKIVAAIQTSWPDIRVVLYRLPDGAFQFCEEGIDFRSGEKALWRANFSGLYADIETAKFAMLQFYCWRVEDEFVVDPESVTILEPPDFEGPYRPTLRLRD